MSIQSFSFQFLFSGYFCSADACVVCSVSSRCNQSSSVFFMLSSSRCIDISTLSRTLAKPFFLLYLIDLVCLRHLGDVRPNGSSLFSGPFVEVLSSTQDHS